MNKYLYHFGFVTKEKEVVVVIDQGITIELLSVEELLYRNINEVLKEHFPNFVIKNGISPVILNFDVINEKSETPLINLLYLIYIEDIDFEGDTFYMHVDTRKFGYLSSIKEGFKHPDLNMDTNYMVEKYVWPIVNHIV